MVVVNRGASSQVFLAPPSSLVSNNQNTSGRVVLSPLSQADTINFSTDSVIPGNYPQVSNNIPTNIFAPQANTSLPVQGNTLPVNNNAATIPATNTTPANTALKPISATEAQWAVKFEEKVQKDGYKPSAEEMAKYQDIVVRFKANPKVDQSILEILASQSSSLGAQVSSMRYGSTVAESLRGLKPGGLKPITPPSVTPVTPPATGAAAGAATKIEGAASGGFGSSLKGLGGTLLKGTGLAAVVSGGFSLITNGIQVFQGKKTWSDVGGTVAADTVNGAVSGLTGTLAAGGATLLAGALGATGIVSTLVVGLGAMGGAWLGDKLFRGTGLYDKIKDKVTSLFTGSSSTAMTPPNQLPGTQPQQYNAASQYAGAQVYRPN
jgi:hypothetical protein